MMLQRKQNDKEEIAQSIKPARDLLFFSSSKEYLWNQIIQYHLVPEIKALILLILSN